MFSVKLFSELTPEAQAACPPSGNASHAVRISESWLGEMKEPRHFFRRAIYVLKAKSAPRPPAKAATKAFALMDVGAVVGVSMGRWSQSGGYDPMPDFLELRELAAQRLGKQSPAPKIVILFRAAIGGYVSGFEELTPAERMRP